MIPSLEDLCHLRGSRGSVKLGASLPTSPYERQRPSQRGLARIGPWIKAGVPGNAGDGGTIAAASPTQLVISTASAASWLYYSGDGAAQWQTVLTEPDGGQGWADLGFTTASDGVVIHAPASKGFAGQLMLTRDGGLTWRQVSF